jgi:hypothetical protein
MKRPYLSTLRRPRRWLWSLAVALTMHGCGGEPSGDPVTVVVARGASFNEVVDSLSSSGIIGRRIEPVFRAYGRLRRADRSIHAGHYEFRRGESWSEVLSDLTSGNVLTVRLTVPEGFTMERMSIRLAVVSEATPDSVRAVLSESEQLVAQMEVPGPTLEGYLFPDTYFFEPGTRLEEVLGAMVSRYKEYWTPERRAKLAELGMTEKEAVTLASIIQAEAVWTREMPAISSVYHNRLRRRQPLQHVPEPRSASGSDRLTRGARARRGAEPRTDPLLLLRRPPRRDPRLHRECGSAQRRQSSGPTGVGYDPVGGRGSRTRAGRRSPSHAGSGLRLRSPTGRCSSLDGANWRRRSA